MSDNTTPIEPVFELQREAITQTVSMLSGPRQLSRSLTDDGAAASQQAQEQTIEITRQALHQALGAAEALGPAGEAGDQLHEGIDEAFDLLAEQQATTCETVATLRKSTDEKLGARTVAALAVLLRANESLEQQTALTAEQLEDAVLGDEDGPTDLSAAVEELAATLEATSEELAAADSGDADPAAESSTEVSPTEELSSVSPESSTEESPAEEEASAEPSTASTEEPSAEESTDAVPAGKVRCRVCGDSFGAITYSHLQTHDMTVEEYTAEFGENVPLRPEDRT